MATRSTVLAWKIPWTEEPGGLQSLGHKESDVTEHTAFPWINVSLFSMCIDQFLDCQ